MLLFGKHMGLSTEQGDARIKGPSIDSPDPMFGPGMAMARRHSLDSSLPLQRCFSFKFTSDLPSHMYAVFLYPVRFQTGTRAETNWL